MRGTLLRARKVLTSRLTLIETRRLVRRAERDRRVSATQASDLLAIFAQAASTWAILEITDEVARRAEDAFPVEPVRTLDAVHLASMLFLRQAFPDLEVLTRDRRVRANVAQLGFVLADGTPGGDQSSDS